jgi:hypothetical protein
MMANLSSSMARVMVMDLPLRQKAGWMIWLVREMVLTHLRTAWRIARVLWLPNPRIRWN